MILPKFIAVRAYLESSGIAFAQKEMIKPLLEELLKKTELTTESGQEILGHDTDTATSIFRLFEHIGIISRRVENKTTYYSFSNIGRAILKDKTNNQDIIQPLTPFFLTWLPFKLFLKYLKERPNSTTDEINRELGEQVAIHTKEFVKYIPLKNVNPEKGVAKPFNKFVISNSLAEIGKFLQLITAEKKDGPFNLTPLGKYVANSIDLHNYNFHKLGMDVDYKKLAILDFLTLQPTEIIVVTQKEQVNNMKKFTKQIADEKYQKLNLKISVKTKKFDAILTKDYAYWANSLVNLSYDPIKVLEIYTNIMNVI